MSRRSDREANRHAHTDDRNIRRWAGKDIRPLTTSFPSIDIADLMEERLLDSGIVGVLAWQTDGEQGKTVVKTVCYDEVLELKIAIPDEGVSHISLFIEKEACRFGGYRKWLICPCCGERKRVFYISETWWRIHWVACRSCAGLAYPTNRMRRFQRLEHRSKRIEERLHWGEDDEPCRPKGMHKKTFDRLVSEYEALIDEASEAYQEEVASWTGWEARLSKLAKRLFAGYC